jgi:hypothetical protein
MGPMHGPRNHWCRSCYRAFGSWLRPQHHWGAEHASRTSDDIARTAQIMTKVHGIPAQRLSAQANTG